MAGYSRRAQVNIEGATFGFGKNGKMTKNKTITC